MNEKTTDASEFEQPERAELFTHETPIEDTPSALPGSFVTKTRLLSVTGSLLPPVGRNDSDIQKTRSRLAPKS